MSDPRALRVVASLEAAVGGPAESSVNACIAAQRAGVSNTLVVLLPDRSREDTAPVRARLAAEGVELISFKPVPHGSHYALRWAFSPALVAWVARCASNYDLIHIHGAWGLSQFGGLLAAGKSRTPCVMSPHEALTAFDVAEDGPNRLRPLMKRSMKAIYLRRLSLIVFSSSLEARDSLPPSPPVRVAVIPHPLRDAFEAPVAGSRYPEESLRIGYLGRLHDKKNVDMLIKAVKSGTKDALLMIAGEGEQNYRQGLEKVVQEAGMRDRVQWMGFLAGDRKLQFLDEVDLLAMPSRYECFGMAAAEAVARGTPVVVSQSTGIADFVERSGSGVVCSPTEDALAQALGTLESDRATLARLAATGPRAASAELSLSAYGDAIRDEYDELIRMHGTPGARRRVRPT